MRSNRLTRILSCVLALGLPLCARAQAAAIPVRDSATALVTAFLATRRGAWQSSERLRHPVAEYARSALPGYGGNPRLQRLHCHGDHAVQGVEVASGSRMRYCPGWAPPRDTLPGDERLDADAGLMPAQRDTVRRARAALLAALGSLGAAASDDGWLLGQRVRFHLDQGDTAEARALVARCGPADWWCLLMRAHVGHTLAPAADAELAFDAAVAVMPPAERCRWTDVGPLLDGREARAQWRALPCDARGAVERRFWWLADPLLSEPGNARRAEHLSRRVLVALRSAVVQDDRMHWEARYGGDALEAMVVRFGWPAYFWWGGRIEDEQHHDWTQRPEQRWGVAPRATFWSAEYPLGRVQVTPDERQWADPFAPDAWAPEHMAAPVRQPLRWKPREHWAPATPLVALADVQVALMRRAGGTLLVAATDPASIVGRRLLVPDDDSLLAALVHTTGPDTVTIVAERRVAARGRVVLAGVVPAGGRALGALELRPVARGAERGTAPRAPRAPSRRARFGLTRPDAAARAISAPVLLEALLAEAPDERAPDESSPDTVDVLARRMLGGTALGGRARVSLYWETYGFAARDTLEVTLRVVRLDRGALARLAGALRVPGFRAEGRDAAGVRWREEPRGGPDAGSTTRAWLRTLDLGALPSGRYRVEVGVASLGAMPVVEARGFTLGLGREQQQ